MRLWLVAVALGLAAPVSASRSSGSVEAEIARLRDGAIDVDLHALRLAAAAQPGFKASGWDDYDAAAKALDSHRDAEALRTAEARLKDNYLDVRAHMVAAEALAGLGRKAEADRQHALAQGLIIAITSDGDGKNAATALTVISVDEEYVVLEVRGIRATRQALHPEGGHYYDVLDVTDGSGAARQMWFNIDLVFGHEL